MRYFAFLSVVPLVCLAAEVPKATSMHQGQVEKVATGYEFTEGPIWSKDGYLVFSDIRKSTVYRLDPPNKVTALQQPSNQANGHAYDREGRLYQCEHESRRVVRLERNGQVTVIADKFEGKPINRPNDVVVSRSGHVYFTDPTREPRELGYAGIYHVTPEGTISLIAKANFPNGVALSPNGKMLYATDAQEHTVLSFDLDSQGKPSNQRTLIKDISGSPDGIRTDTKGNLYVAAENLFIYSPAGVLLDTIQFPETPANIGFGDKDLKTLYVTARTSLYKVRTKEKGFLPY